MEVFDTPDKAELVSQIQITGPRHPFKKTCVFRLPLKGLKAGDILHAESQGECTHQYKYNCMLGFQIVLEDAGGKLLWEFTEGQGYNITPAMHHGTFQISRTRKLPKDLGDCQIAVYLWAASSNVVGTQYLKVEKDYGWLSGFVVRGQDGATTDISK